MKQTAPLPLTFMRILVAAVSAEQQYVKSLISFHTMRLKKGDLRVAEFGKPGIHARKIVGTRFEDETEYDALLMLDLDMLFPDDMLEKLRSHDLDMVTAHYFRRRTDPMMSIVQVDRGGWPYIPILDIPTEGLHEVASTGFGAVLIKREVYMAVKDSLPLGMHPFDNGPLEWLTGDYAHFGADVRFFCAARQLGYKLWLDASLECAHGHVVWLTNKLYKKLGDRDNHHKNWDTLFNISKELNGMDKKTAQIRIEQLEMARKEVDDEHTEFQSKADELETKLAVIDGQIAEREVDLTERDYPPGAKPVDLPVLGSKEAVEKAVENRGKSPYGHESEGDVHNDARWVKGREDERKHDLDLLSEVREEIHGGDAD